MTPPWHTPSHLRLDEAARATLRVGRALHEPNALIAAITDPRLGTCPLAVQVLTEVIACTSGTTRMAYPGLDYLRQQVEHHMQGQPTRLSPGGIRNAMSLLTMWRYVVSERRSPEGQGRAVAHYAITIPAERERRRAIGSYLADPSARARRRPECNRCDDLRWGR